MIHFTGCFVYVTFRAVSGFWARPAEQFGFFGGVAHGLLLSWASEVVAKWCAFVCVFERVLRTVCGAIRLRRWSQSGVCLRDFERGFGNGLRGN